MKKRILILVSILVPLLAIAQTAKMYGLGFVAPQVGLNPTEETDVVANPQQGEIVFYKSGSTTGTFYGYDGNSWESLGISGTVGLWGTATSAGTANCTWVYTTGSWGNLSADNDCPSPSVTQNASAPGTKIPGISFTTLPAGNYQVVVNGLFAADPTTNCLYRISDGTNTSGWAYVTGYEGGSASIQNLLMGTFSYGSTQSNITFQVQAYRAAGSFNCSIFNSTSGQIQLVFSVIKI